MSDATWGHCVWPQVGIESINRVEARAVRTAKGHLEAVGVDLQSFGLRCLLV